MKNYQTIDPLANPEMMRAAHREPGDWREPLASPQFVAKWQAKVADQFARGRARLPRHMHRGLINWLAFGVMPGGFLQAVLRNDLVQAFARADAENTAAMREWAAFLYDDMPRGAWGSEKTIAEWQRIGGLSRHNETKGGDDSNGE
jgi:hypothetical protein